jgi:Lon-like ATP-dependent protease
VDNSNQTAPFVDATGHRSSQLFGSIAWDPLQTGGLGTPEHQRVTAGDVHRACLGILYIDEIKNLHPEEAVTLLTVLEEGQLPITLRSRWQAGGTAAMAVSTEPVPCLCFLVGAGNFDSINQIHPALMDRIFGYGKVVRMNNDMPNTIENRRKYVQFIAQECKRFRLKPFSREACIELINEGRRRSNKKNALTTKFRPLISIIKTAAILAENEMTEFVERRHVIEAINKHCKTIQKQILEHQIQEKGELMEIDPTGYKLGTVYGLSVVMDPVSGEKTGSILRVKASMTKRGKREKGYFKVTGIAKEAKFIKDSIDKVRTVILKKYNVDIAQDYCTHIDFSQAYGVDGPSAGVTMTILLCSILEGKPIRQDIAVTGEINVSTTDEIEITAVGGLHEKIKAAEAWNFKKVVIPEKNLEHSIVKNDYQIEVVGAGDLDQYLKEVLVDEELNNEEA